MADFEEPSRTTRRDPGVTRADRATDETRRDASVPHPTPPGDPLVRLPGPLGQRFEVVSELPVQGAESDLLLVGEPVTTDVTEDPGGGRDAHLVVKIYRRGYHADRDVWAKLPSLDSPHVMRVLETGHADGRDYELLEYLPEGNLRAVIPADRPRLDPETVTEIVAQLADGLHVLHESGIVHRDLKPENVLVASREPLRLVITDFGLSRVLEQSVVFASSSRTLAYAAPESLSGQVSPARDWWSLGMIARELLTGRPPFAGMSETVVVDHLATRPIDNDDIADPRLRLLCRGLLGRDPRRRWGAAEVTGWLRGDSPEVTDEPAPSEAARPEDSGPAGRAPRRADVHVAGPGVPFDGRRFTDRRELARALVANWEPAARFFFARGESGEAWRALRDGLAGLDDDPGSDPGGRIELVDTHLTGPWPPEVKLLHLVRWLDPTLPPHYLGRRTTAADLPSLAALAADERHPDHRTACLIGRALWEHRLLPVLADFTGTGTGPGGEPDDTRVPGSEGTGPGLREIDDRWQRRVAEWNRLATTLRPGLPPPAATRLPEAGAPAEDEPPVVLLMLLALAVDPGGTARMLSESVRGARDAVTEPVAWFDPLMDSAGSDPLVLLAILRTAPVAAAEAEAAVRDRAAAVHRASERLRLWQEQENTRLAGRAAAVRSAVLWSLPLLALWTVGALALDALFGGSGSQSGTQSVGGFQRSPGLPVALLIAAGVGTWAVEAAGEVLLARRQGRDYLPYGPWSWISRLLGKAGRGLSTVSRAVSGTAQRSGRRGCGFLLIAGVVPILLLLILFGALTSLASVLWLLTLVAVAAGHAIGAGVRMHHWRQAHEVAKRQALEGAA